jgi:hypothetical protein
MGRVKLWGGGYRILATGAVEQQKSLLKENKGRGWPF